MDHAEVNVVTLPVEQWIRDYYRPAQFADACRMCPNFGKVWSCPPLMHQVPQMLKPFSRVHLVGVKVVYRKETIAATDTAAKADRVRVQTYDKVKRIFLESLLELEKEIPGSWAIAAGECKICKKCARQDGLPCRHPDRMRYSFSGFGFDLVKIAHDLFHYELLWNPNGLPEYTVAFGALLDRQDRSVQQEFTLEDARPWQLLQEQVLGVLSQLGLTLEGQQSIDCEKIYFDTAEGTLLEQGSALHLTKEADGVRLVWKHLLDQEPEGLFFPEIREMDLEDAPAGAVAEFVRQQLGQHSVLVPGLEAEDHRVTAELTDRSAGEAYRLIFHDLRYRDIPGDGSRSQHSLELVSLTGAGRRIRQIASCLQTRFPELQCADSPEYPRGKAK